MQYKFTFTSQIETQEFLVTLEGREVILSAIGWADITDEVHFAIAYMLRRNLKQYQTTTYQITKEIL